MILEILQDLYAYNSWANQRVLDTTEQLTAEQFTADAGPSHGSLRNTFVHMMGGQQLWLARWKGGSPERMSDPERFPDLASVRQYWGKLDAETRAFVDQLTEQQLQQTISYTTTEGEPRSYPMWQPVFQQINHSTAHRSEAAVMLTNYGHSPGDLDYIVYRAIQRKSTGS